MTTKDIIKKLAILSGLFLVGVGSITNDKNFLIVGMIITIVGEGVFLL